MIVRALGGCDSLGRCAVEQTHPRHDCFLSSVDLHVHYRQQLVSPLSVAVVYSALSASERYRERDAGDEAG
jgi:hypothetical protein